MTSGSSNVSTIIAGLSQIIYSNIFFWTVYDYPGQFLILWFSVVYYEFHFSLYMFILL